MRPLRYPQMAPNGGLALGSSIANGISNAMSDYLKIKNQRMMAQYHMQMAQGMGAYRQAQANALQRKTADLHMSRINFVTAAHNAKDANGNPLVDPSITKSLTKDYLEEYANTATPGQLAEVTGRLNALADKGQVAPEVSSWGNKLNPAEQSYMKTVTTTQSGEKRAAIRADAQRDTADQHYQAMVDAAKISAGSKPSAEQRAAHLEAEAYKQQIGFVTKGLMDIDKPKVDMFGKPIPVDPGAAQVQKAALQSTLDHLNDKFGAALSRVAGKPVVVTPPPMQNDASSAPGGASPQPKRFSADQWQQAQPGDIVVHPEKGPLVRLPENHADGSAAFAPAPAQAPAQSASPAPAAPAMSQGTQGDN